MKLCNIHGRIKVLFVKIFEFTDERVSDLFLVKSVWPITTIIVAYLIFVTGKGQEWMKNRPPFELKNTLILYNLFQIVLNLYTAVGVSLRSFFLPRMFFFIYFDEMTQIFPKTILLLRQPSI